MTIVLSSREEDICIAPSDAPALALAVLEAAYPEAQGRPNLVHDAIGLLIDKAEQDEIKEAEAREQAELEAEAFEYLKAVYTVTGARVPAKFSDLNAGVRSHYLIIARRARELAQEGK